MSNFSHFLKIATFKCCWLFSVNIYIVLVIFPSYYSNTKNNQTHPVPFEHLYTKYCMEVTSLCASLAIEGHTDGDGKKKHAPVAVKLEGAEQGKEGGTAPAVTTMAPDKPAGLSGDACCKCGHQLS